MNTHDSTLGSTLYHSQMIYNGEINGNRSSSQWNTCK